MNDVADSTVGQLKGFADETADMEYNIQGGQRTSLQHHL